MTFIVDGTNGLTFPNSTVQASAGKVLQVATGTIATQISTTSTSFITTGLTVSITPKFSTSKILIIANGTFESTVANNVFATIYRNSTNIGSSTAGMTQTNQQGVWIPFGINYLDSPATTSSTSYTVYYRQGVGNTAYFGGDSCLSSITVMEIAV